MNKKIALTLVVLVLLVQFFCFYQILTDINEEYSYSAYKEEVNLISEINSADSLHKIMAITPVMGDGDWYITNHTINKQLAKSEIYQNIIKYSSIGLLFFVLFFKKKENE